MRKGIGGAFPTTPPPLLVYALISAWIRENLSLEECGEVKRGEDPYWPRPQLTPANEVAPMLVAALCAV